MSAMIVSCPACSARYKIPEAKIKGRGAKITCPKCAHVFVVYKDGEQGAEAPATPELAERDFREVGITWKVRNGLGLITDLHDLATLREYLEDGQVDDIDSLSYDNREWKPIHTIDDLEAYFADVWERASRGEIHPAAVPAVMGGGEEDEDDADAPTTIVSQGTSLADEIRKAVKEAATPAPVPSRDSEAPTVQLSEEQQSAPPPAKAPGAGAEPFKGLQPRSGDADAGISPGLLLGAVVVVLLIAAAGAVGLGVVPLGGDDAAPSDVRHEAERPAAAGEPTAPVPEPSGAATPGEEAGAPVPASAATGSAASAGQAEPATQTAPPAPEPTPKKAAPAPEPTPKKAVAPKAVAPEADEPKAEPAEEPAEPAAPAEEDGAGEAAAAPEEAVEPPSTDAAGDDAPASGEQDPSGE